MYHMRTRSCDNFWLRLKKLKLVETCSTTTNNQINSLLGRMLPNGFTFADDKAKRFLQNGVFVYEIPRYHDYAFLGSNPPEPERDQPNQMIALGRAQFGLSLGEVVDISQSDLCWSWESTERDWMVTLQGASNEYKANRDDFSSLEEFYLLRERILNNMNRESWGLLFYNACVRPQYVSRMPTILRDTSRGARWLAPHPSSFTKEHLAMVDEMITKRWKKFSDEEQAVWNKGANVCRVFCTMNGGHPAWLARVAAAVVLQRKGRNMPWRHRHCAKCQLLSDLKKLEIENMVGGALD